MNEFLTRIYARNFDEAQQYLSENIGQFKSYNASDNQQAYDNIIRNKQFLLLDFLVDNNLVETDIYEYDAFNRSIFDSLFTNFPVDSDSLSYLKKLIGKFDNINDEIGGQTLLSFALSQKAAPEILQTLIDAGCSPLFKNTAQDNLVAQAATINMITPEKQLAYVKLLMDAGADINDLNVERKNVLHLAVESYKKHLIPYLLEQGAQVNEQDWKGNTVFHQAFSNPDDEIIIPLLLEHVTPDFESENTNGEKPLSIFLRYMNGSEKSIRNLEKIIDAGADLQQASQWYNRPKSGWDWIVEKKPELLEAIFAKASPDVNMQDNDGNTLLHKVCSIDCNHSQETAKDIYRKVKFLIKEGADANLTNNKDETPLLIASKDNLKTKTVALLLNAAKK